VREHTRLVENDAYSPFSKCPGQYFAELSTWLGVASILAAFDVTPALDDNGNPVDVEYALIGIGNFVT